jgi:hypothetical protein
MFDGQRKVRTRRTLRPPPDRGTVACHVAARCSAPAARRRSYGLPAARTRQTPNGPRPGSGMNDRTPVPLPLLRRLWVALGGAALFLAVATAQGALRAGYDPWHQAVSALSLGPGGWVQTLNFVAFGAIVASTAPVWRRVLAGGTGATAYPTLIAVLGGSLITAGVVPQDPAPGYDPEGLALGAPTPLGLLHLASAGVAAVCSVAGLFVMAARFAGDPDWGGWPAYSRVTALLVIACVLVYAGWSTRASGLAGTFERLAIVLPLLWTFTFLRRLSAGMPFMVAGPRGGAHRHGPNAAGPRTAAHDSSG